MINAFPFFSGLMGSLLQGSGQTGGIGLDQPLTPTGKFSDNPFAKILYDQPVISSQSKNSVRTVSSANQGPVSDLGMFLGNPELAVQVLPALNIQVDMNGAQVFLEGELPLPDDGQANPSPVIFLETNGQKETEPEYVISTALLSASEVYREIHVGESEIPTDHLEPLPVNYSHERPQASAVVSFSASIAGESLTSDVKIDKSFAPIISPKGQYILPDILKESLQSQKISEEKPVTGFIKAPEKLINNPLDHLSPSVQNTASVQSKMVVLPTGPLQDPLRPLGYQAFHAPLPFEDTPAGMADGVLSSQYRLKYVTGMSSVINEVSGNGKESVILSDVRGDFPLSATGDRSKDASEMTGKITGIDPNGGQGFNNGMGHSTNSQPGFHQSSTFHSQGSGVRIAEERVPDLPAPALQRLQMDVQLSETNRVQIDVGVQHRQVYAGLLMDQASLKNLAVQFVPQLEEQLALSDMDLQEFSAEVRDHHGGQESDTHSQRAGIQSQQHGVMTLPHAPEVFPHTVKGIEEQGMHFVA